MVKRRENFIDFRKHDNCKTYEIEIVDLKNKYHELSKYRSLEVFVFFAYLPNFMQGVHLAEEKDWVTE
jgi:hypothetical protein